jgi:glycylpeptide N-tetradecanoyltransferase
MPMSRYVKMHKVPEDTDIVGIRKMEAKDVPIVHKKLNDFLKQFKLHIQFTVEEIAHFMIPRDNVIEAYVVEDPESKAITDFISFYSLPSSILRHPDYNTLYVAYQYYYFTDKYTIT